MLILFLSAPRCGTTRFGEVLRTLDVRFLEEPFNPGAYSGMGFYSDLFTLSEEGRRLARHPRLVADLLPNPLVGFARREWARTLLRTSVKLESMATRNPIWKFAMKPSIRIRNLCHQVIPPVSPFRSAGVPRIIAELLDESEGTYVLEIHSKHLASEDDLKYLCSHYPSLILQRRMIDSYISRLKALSLRSWQHADTTSRKVAADPSSYVAYCNNMRGWYDKCVGYRKVYFDSLGEGHPLSGARNAIINYEDWSYLDNRDQPKRVYSLLVENGFKEFISMQNSSESEGIKRQDLSLDWSSKILNPELLQKGLEEISSAHLLLDSPLPAGQRHE